MNGRTQSRLVQLAKEHPVIAGALFVVAGALITSSSISKGTEYAQFIDGPSVSGTVVELRGDYSIPASFEMTAKWKDKKGRSHSGTISLFKAEFEELKKGSKIPLLLSRSEPSNAMVASYFGNSKPITVAGVSTTPLGFVGAAMALLGLVYAIHGLRQ